MHMYIYIINIMKQHPSAQKRTNQSNLYRGLALTAKYTSSVKEAGSPRHNGGPIECPP